MFHLGWIIILHFYKTLLNSFSSYCEHSGSGLTTGIITVFCDLYPDKNKTMITGIICLVGFGIGIVYVTPGGQAILSLVDYFGGGFIIFVIAIVEVIAVR